MIKKLALAVATIGCLAATQASAVPSFSLNGGYTGAIKIKFSNWESFDTIDPQTGLPVVGGHNYGILKISTVESDDGNNTLLWSSGQGGGELTGVFSGITLTAVTPSGGGFDLVSTGGALDLYLNPVGTFAGAGGANQGNGGYAAAGGGCLINQNCYNGISNAAGGALFLGLDWVSGIDPLDATTTIDGGLDGSTFPGTGDAGGFLDVTGGAYAFNFDTNGQSTAFGNRDLFAQNDFCVNGTVGCASPAQGDWQLVSEDPVRASFRVPEPGTLLLGGIGLLGLGFSKRRRAA